MDQQPMAGTSGCGDSIDMQRVNLEGNMFMEQWNEYLEVLASKAPTPGGGSAAAVYGAIGTALGEMVGNLTAGKKKFAIYEEDVQRILVRLGEARMDFIRLEKADEQAFRPLSEVYRMKAETEEEKRIKDERMEECLKEAYAEGITVIPVGHHNLQRLSRVYVEECVIENCDEVLELFERYLTPVYFSGHLHTQKVMKHLTEPGMDSDTYGIWEIVSNSLILPPCQYGTVTLNTDGSIDYLAKIVNVSSWAAANGETDENLLDFSSYTENYLQTVLKNQIARKLEDVPKELREVMVDFYTDLYKDYYAGVPISYSEKKNEFGYGLWVRYMDPSTEFRQLDGMMRDSISANNHAEIPNPIHLKRP